MKKIQELIDSNIPVTVITWDKITGEQIITNAGIRFLEAITLLINKEDDKEVRVYKDLPGNLDCFHLTEEDYLNEAEKYRLRII